MMFKPYLPLLMIVLSISHIQHTYAGGIEDSNDCPTNPGDFCTRAGSCDIQGSAWYQFVTIDKSEIFDRLGWPGLCDLTHVSLIQGTCSPPGAQENVTAYLSDTSFAEIPAITGLLACGADAINVFTVGGVVSGLLGDDLQLQNNSEDDLLISADGSFTFATALVDGSAYVVTVLTQPAGPSQTCVVSNGSGTLAGIDITNVKVNCISLTEMMFTDSFE